MKTTDLMFIGQLLALEHLAINLSDKSNIVAAQNKIEQAKKLIREAIEIEKKGVSHASGLKQ